MPDKSRSNSLSRSTEDQFFMYLRVNTLNKLVPYAAARFIDNLPMIFSGEFNHALLEDDSSFSQLLELYKTWLFAMFSATRMSNSWSCKDTGLSAGCWKFMARCSS